MRTDEEARQWEDATIDLMSDEEDSVLEGQRVWLVVPPDGRSPELSALCQRLERRRGSHVTRRVHQDGQQDAGSFLSLLRS